MLGVDPKLLESMVSNIEAISDRKLRDVITFSVKCARDPQSLTAADYDLLRKHDYSQSQIVEIVAMSALAVYANVIADATAVDDDEMFGQV